MAATVLVKLSACVLLPARYAANNGYPVLEHVTLPRIGAVKMIIDTLNVNTTHSATNGVATTNGTAATNGTATGKSNGNIAHSETANGTIKSSADTPLTGSY